MLARTAKELTQANKVKATQKTCSHTCQICKNYVLRKLTGSRRYFSYTLHQVKRPAHASLREQIERHVGRFASNPSSNCHLREKQSILRFITHNPSYLWPGQHEFLGEIVRQYGKRALIAISRITLSKNVWIRQT